MTSHAALPNGVTKAEFRRAVEEYRAALGADQVIVDLEKLVPYTKIMIPEDESLHQPSGVLAAKTVEQIQQVVAISNRHKIPLWTISTGRNFGYGSAAPATVGQMVLDLRGMNRIIDVDAEMCTALVEPGVTFQQLQDYIRERNLPLWLNFPSPGPLVGPIGNTLDRGVGYNRNAVQMDNFCGMEVVLANGEVLRTATGGNPNSKTWQCYRWGYGAWTDGIFTQSNLGIVTKLGLWLMPAPKAHLTYTAGWKDINSMCKAMDICRELSLQKVMENGVLGHNLYGIAGKVKRADVWPGPGSLPPEVADKICESVGIPPWSLYGTLYGVTEEQIAVNLKIVKDALASTGAEFLTKTEVGDAHPGLNHWASNQTSKLSLSEFGVYNFRGGGGNAWFSPVLPTRGRDFLRSYTLSLAVLNEFGFDYLGGMQILGRHSDHIQALAYNRADPEEMKRAYACFKKLAAVHAAEGYNLYRANIAFMDMVADTYGAAQRAINKKLKHALDPNGILAPGKSGVTL